MIGGGGSTAYRAAADVIGTIGAGRCTGGGGCDGDDDDDDDNDDDDDDDDDELPCEACDDDVCIDDGEAAIDGEWWWYPELSVDVGALGAIDDGIIGRGWDGGVGRGVIGVIATLPSPKKSFTRVSTSWLIEMLLASQNAFSRS
jgi:hypothetical protein